MSAPNPAAAAKPPVLSYAERAKRAGAAAPATSATQQPPRARPSVSNGNGRVPGESASPASSNISNIAQTSAPPLQTSSSASETTQSPPAQSGNEENLHQQQKTIPAVVPKSPSKPPTTNVWTARKEQMAQRVAAQQSQIQPTVNTGANMPVNQVASSSTLREAAVSEPQTRPLVNGVANASYHDDLASSMSAKADDPFVVRIPPQLNSQATPIATRTPPSLDDIESWPEMGKGGPSVSTSASGSVIAGSTGSDGDKKETLTSTHKKGEITFPFVNLNLRSYLCVFHFVAL